MLDDYRARGLDENLVPNTLCPTTAKTREAWRKWFIERGIGLQVRSAAAQASKDTEVRRATKDRAKAGKLTLWSVLAAIAASAPANASSPTRAATGQSASDHLAAHTPESVALLSTAPASESHWRELASTADTVKQLATEESMEAKGMGIVGCVRCFEVIAVKLDDRAQGRGWAHSCPRAPSSTTGDFTREYCWEGRLHFASQLHRYPGLLKQARNVLEVHKLGDVLEGLETGPLRGYTDLLPPNFTASDQHPPVLVVPGSRPEWISVNAIALAHDLTPGSVPKLEYARPPPKDALAGIVRAVGQAGSGKVNIVACERDSCDFVIFNGRVGRSGRQHTCRQPAADGALPSMRQAASIVTAFELPAVVRVGVISVLRSDDGNGKRRPQRKLVKDKQATQSQRKTLAGADEEEEHDESEEEVDENEESTRTRNRRGQGRGQPRRLEPGLDRRQQQLPLVEVGGFRAAVGARKRHRDRDGGHGGLVGECEHPHHLGFDDGVVLDPTAVSDRDEDGELARAAPRDERAALGLDPV